MVKRLIVVAAFIAVTSISLFAADISTTTCPGAGCIDVPVSSQTAVGVQVTGTFVGTITFYGSVDGTNFIATLVTPVGSDTKVSTATGTGIWTKDTKGLKVFRIGFSAYTSGTAVVTTQTTAK